MIDALKFDDYLDIFNEGYNCSHTYRGFESHSELKIYRTNPTWVHFSCRNSLCLYEWYNFKNIVLKNKQALKESLVCPVCNKYHIECRWGYFNKSFQSRWLPKTYFLYDVVLNKKRINSYSYPETMTDSLPTGILHIHLQFPTVFKSQKN